MEACRIEIRADEIGGVNVAAPMRYKPLCYEMLDNARFVVNQTPPHLFGLERGFAIVMDMDGVVDVSAPLPERDLCLLMLDQARTVIERYEGEGLDARNPLLGV